MWSFIRVFFFFFLSCISFKYKSKVQKALPAFCNHILLFTVNAHVEFVKSARGNLRIMRHTNFKTNSFAPKYCLEEFYETWNLRKKKKSTKMLFIEILPFKALAASSGTLIYSHSLHPQLLKAFSIPAALLSCIPI